MRKTVLPLRPIYAITARSYLRQCRLLLTGLFVIIAHRIPAQPIAPKFSAFKPVSTTQAAPPQPVQPFGPGGINPLFSNDPNTARNYQILQQAGIMDIPGQPGRPRMQQHEEVKVALAEEAREERNLTARPFQQALQQFLQLNPDQFSITRAIYLAERAYDPEMPPFVVFENAIKEWGELVKQILHREGLSVNDNTAVMYGIQKLFRQSNLYYDQATKTNSTIQPIRYDFNDPMGDKDWRNMSVNKLLKTRTGQCHSLPLFYLCVAEQLNAKAYLSLSPNHSFIQHFDSTGHRYNFECTNGNVVTQTWLMGSTFVNATALKKGTYLDTLSSSQLYAQCLADLMLGYISKMGYDQYSDAMTKHILSIDRHNITALMTQANYFTFIFRDKLQQAGSPPQKDFPNYPGLNEAYKAMQEAQQSVEQTGFQEMPVEAYQKWLKSLEQEKQKQQNRVEQERLKREIEKLKKIKVTFKNSPIQ